LLTSFKVSRVPILIVFSGSCTWCTEQNGHCELFAIGQEDCPVKASTILRHCERKHNRVQKEVRPRKKRKHNDGNGRSAKYRNVSLSQEVKMKIRDANLGILCKGQVKALSTFNQPEFIARDAALLEAVGVNPDVANDLAVSRSTTRRDLFDKSEKQRAEIALKIPVIARKIGGVGISFDHKSVARHYLSCSTNQVLGTCITITSKPGERVDYLLEMPEAVGHTHTEAKSILADVLIGYGLYDSAKSGHITAISDYGLHEVSSWLSFNHAVDGNHSIDRLIKRTLEELLHKFCKNGHDEFQKLKRFTTAASKCLTKRELRTLPEATQPSLNDYLMSQGGNVIRSFAETRFRGVHDNLKSLVDAKPFILPLVGQEDDPNHRHVLNLPNWAYIEVVYDLLSTRFLPLINFNDSEKHCQTGDYLPQMEFLLEWACLKQFEGNQFAKPIQDCLIATILEQLVGAYILKNKVEKSSVRNRLLGNELIAIYGTVPRKSMNLSKIRHILELGNRPEEAKLVKDYVRRVDLQLKAKEHIKQYDLLLNGDPDVDDGFDSNILEEFFDSDDSDIIPRNYSANQRSVSSSNSHLLMNVLDKELDKYEKMDKTLLTSYASFCDTNDWRFKKTDRGLILQNHHLRAYWTNMMHIFPRLSKVMIHVLFAPTSSSCIERYFSTFSLNTNPIASNRSIELLELYQQNNPKNVKFFELLDTLYSECTEN